MIIPGRSWVAGIAMFGIALLQDLRLALLCAETTAEGIDAFCRCGLKHCILYDLPAFGNSRQEADFAPQ
jgi:hypothetical protein